MSVEFGPASRQVCPLEPTHTDPGRAFAFLSILPAGGALPWQWWQGQDPST